MGRLSFYIKNLCINDPASLIEEQQVLQTEIKRLETIIQKHGSLAISSTSGEIINTSHYNEFVEVSKAISDIDIALKFMKS